MKCSCQHNGFDEPPCCATCVYGCCPGCTYPNEIECRRHAPAVSPAEYRSSRGLFPRVSRSEWCGDYVYDPSDEEKT